MCASADVVLHDGYRSWTKFWVNTLDRLSGSWIMDIFLFFAYISGGLFFFLRSLTRILAFWVGCLRLPSAMGTSVGAFTSISSVPVLSSEQLEAHNKCLGTANRDRR